MKKYINTVSISIYNYIHFLLSLFSINSIKSLFAKLGNFIKNIYYTLKEKLCLIYINIIHKLTFKNIILIIKNYLLFKCKRFIISFIFIISLYIILVILHHFTNLDKGVIISLKVALEKDFLNIYNYCHTIYYRPVIPPVQLQSSFSLWVIGGIILSTVSGFIGFKLQDHCYKNAEKNFRVFDYTIIDITENIKHNIINYSSLYLSNFALNCLGDIHNIMYISPLYQIPTFYLYTGYSIFMMRIFKYVINNGVKSCLPPEVLYPYVTQFNPYKKAWDFIKKENREVGNALYNIEDNMINYLNDHPDFIMDQRAVQRFFTYQLP